MIETNVQYSNYGRQIIWIIRALISDMKKSKFNHLITHTNSINPKSEFAIQKTSLSNKQLGLNQIFGLPTHSKIVHVI